MPTRMPGQRLRIASWTMIAAAIVVLPTRSACALVRPHAWQPHAHPVAITYPLPPPPVSPGLLHGFLALYAEYVESDADDSVPFAAWLLQHGVHDRSTFVTMMSLYRWMVHAQA